MRGADGTEHHARRATWRNAVILIAALTLLRVVYLVAFCPYELVADEAHYWEWSRRPALSYYTKGPGVAWVIAASTEVFGDRAWAIRLPTALATALGALAVGWFAKSMTDDESSGFYAVMGYLLLPGYVALAQLMTIDGPYVACWALTVWFAWRAMDGRRAWAWPAMGAALGAGFLFKYTILLLIPGLILYAVLARRRLSRGAWGGWLVALLTFAVVASPVFIWNAQHGWPTIAHQLGRLNLPGGDAEVAWNWSPLWFLSFVGAQVGIVGPVGVAMMALGVVYVYHRRREPGTPTAGTLLAVCSAGPILGFYLIVAIFKQAQGNWALGAYGPLLVPAGWMVSRELARYARLLSAWRTQPQPRPKMGLMRRKPETLGQIVWHWYVACGIGALIVIGVGPAFARLPGLDRVKPLQRGMSRVTGHAAEAQRMAALMEKVEHETGREPAIVAARYDKASLLAFYLPGKPATYCASALLGSRRTSYDYFPDTDLDEARASGRPLLLVGGAPAAWREALGVASVADTDDADVWLVVREAGP